eukprot:scaffold6142_cov257-Pinguiococcus_pyrenoidosus.AAC.3
MGRRPAASPYSRRTGRCRCVASPRCPGLSPRERSVVLWIQERDGKYPESAQAWRFNSEATRSQTSASSFQRFRDSVVVNHLARPCMQ